MHDKRLDYIKFVFFPTRFPATKPPSLFPQYSAIGKEKGHLVVGTGDAANAKGGKLNLVFVPTWPMNT